MGSREASLHLRCEDRGTLLPKLKTLLDDPSFWREETEDLLGLLGQVFEQQLPQLDETKQRAGKAFAGLTSAICSSVGCAMRVVPKQLPAVETIISTNMTSSR